VHVARHAIAIGIARHAGQQVERACQVPLDGVARRREIQAIDFVEGRMLVEVLIGRVSSAGATDCGAATRGAPSTVAW
jgi:hypothetical protein